MSSSWNFPAQAEPSRGTLIFELKPSWQFRYVKKSQKNLTHFFPKFLLSEVSKWEGNLQICSVVESGYLDQFHIRVGKNALVEKGKNAKFCWFSSLYRKIIELKGKGQEPSRKFFSSSQLGSGVRNSLETSKP